MLASLCMVATRTQAKIGRYKVRFVVSLSRMRTLMGDVNRAMGATKGLSALSLGVSFGLPFNTSTIECCVHFDTHYSSFCWFQAIILTDTLRIVSVGVSPRNL
ncbi:hypothetical protein D3C72_1149650 [compost metagenome]